MASNLGNLGLDLSKNLSFFAVPAAFLCALGPHSYAIIAAGKVYNNDKPTALMDNLSKDTALSESSKARLTRAHLATENGLQTLGLFAASIVAANQAGVEPVTLNTLAWGYVASRVGYNVVYIALGGTANTGVLRSSLWATSIGLSLTLWVKAGLKIMDSYVF